MSVSHAFDFQSSPALKNLSTLLEQRFAIVGEEAAASQPVFERALRNAMGLVEREILKTDFERLDVDVAGVIYERERYRRKHHVPAIYMTLAGEIEVERTVYEKRGGHGGDQIVPLELRLGLVDGHWTRVAAEVGNEYMACNPSALAAELLSKTGVMSPSASHLDRLPKHFSTIWEANRPALEAEVREKEELPDEDSVSLILVSLDGVMVPMKGGMTASDTSGKEGGGTHHKEAGSATIGFYNEVGERLHTLRWARMPEYKKITLQEQMQEELKRLEELYLSAKFRMVADGAKENWRILNELNGKLNLEAELALDYWHALEHVGDAMSSHFGTGTDEAKKRTGYWAHELLEADDATNRLMAELGGYASQHRGAAREEIEKQITYIGNHKEMMQYRRLREGNRPVGSGIQEAACKTLVSERMKRSGMSWSQSGGQAILTLRSLHQSERLSLAWDVLHPKLRKTFEVDSDTKRQRPSRLAA